MLARSSSAAWTAAVLRQRHSAFAARLLQDPSSSSASRLVAFSRHNSSQSTSQANAEKGSADAAPPSQQAAEQVGRQAEAELAGPGSPVSQPGTPSSSLSQEASTAEPPQDGSARRSGSTYSRLRSIISASNKGAPSTGKGTNAGRGANVAGATSQNRKSRPSARSQPAKPDASAPADSLGEALEAVDNESLNDLKQRANSPHRATSARNPRDRPRDNYDRPQRGNRDDSDRPQRRTREDSDRPQRRNRLDQYADDRDGSRQKSYRSANGDRFARREQTRDGPEARERERTSESTWTSRSSRDGTRSEGASSLLRSRTQRSRQQLAPSPPTFLPQITTDWNDALRRSPKPLDPNSVLQAQPPTAPRFPGMGDVLKAGSQDAGSLQPVIVPGPLRHKQAVHLLKILMPLSRDGVPRPNWQQDLVSAGTGSTSSNAGEDDASGVAVTGKGAGSSDNELAQRVASKRKQIVAETVGGSYDRHLGASAEQVEAAEKQGASERVLSRAKHVLGQNSSVSVAGKEYVAAGLAEKLKQLRV